MAIAPNQRNLPSKRERKKRQEETPLDGLIGLANTFNTDAGREVISIGQSHILNRQQKIHWLVDVSIDNQLYLLDAHYDTNKPTRRKVRISPITDAHDIDTIKANVAKSLSAGSCFRKAVANYNGGLTTPELTQPELLARIRNFAEASVIFTPNT